MNQLDEILTTGKNSKILIFFLNNPTRELSQKEIIEEVNIAKNTAIKWLKSLVNKDILNCKKIGVTNLHRLNNKNIIVKQLKILNTLIKLQPLEELNKDIEIFLYGSAARGEETEESDIDLLILGNTKRNEIIEALDNLGKRINKKINFRIFTNIEWSMMQKEDKAYYERVEKDKVKIYESERLSRKELSKKDRTKS